MCSLGLCRYVHVPEIKFNKYEPSHAFRPVAENELCRHVTGFVQMGHYVIKLNDMSLYLYQILSDIVETR